MSPPLRNNPNIGDVVTFVDTRKGVRLPVKVVKVYAAVCVVEVLSGGLFDSLKGKEFRTHISRLYKQY